MALPWFRVDVEVVDHPKVHHLEALLGPNSGWYLLRLWTWTARFASRGRLANVARASLERSCGWTGKPGELIAAFLVVGLLDETTTDELEVHDWWEKQGSTVEKAEKDRERLRTSRERRGVVARTSRDARAVVAGDVTLRDETLRDTKTAPKKPALPRESDSLVADFLEVIGKPYVWNGAKDGVAFARLRKDCSLEEIRNRWRTGLKSSDKWASCRTVAQLASKWNDLAKAPPLGANWREQQDYDQPFLPEEPS